MSENQAFLEQVTAVARRHCVEPGQVREVAGGVANRGFVLGEDLFLRVARSGYEEDLRRETVVVPAARSAGVRTPAIVEYDETRRVVEAPYVVMERVHGSEPAGVPSGLAQELAQQLAGLHGIGRIPGVPEDDRGDPWRTAGDLVDRGYVDSGTAEWLTGWFTRLSERFDRNQPKVLIHGDVAAHNLLAGPDGELRALIDWGDAAVAPRAMEFAKLPLTEVAAMLPQYLRHAGVAVREEEFAAEVLWFHLFWAVGKLAADPWPDQRHWTAPPGSRILALLRFFASAPPAPWSTLA